MSALGSLKVGCTSHSSISTKDCLRYFSRTIVVLLALALTSPFAWPVIGSPATRQRLTELEEARLSAARDIYMQELRLGELRMEAQAMLDEIRYFDVQMTSIKNTVFFLEESLARTDIEIYYANASLDAARHELELQFESFGATLRAMQEADPLNTLNILLGAESIADFFIRLEGVRELLRFNAGAIERLEAAQHAYMANIDALELLHARNSDLMFQFALEHENLLVAQDERQQRFAEQLENEESLQLFLEILHAEHIAIEAELGAARTEFDAEQAAFELTRRASGSTPRPVVQVTNGQMSQVGQLFGSSGVFAWPVPSVPYASIGFGFHNFQFGGGRIHHNGIDIIAPSGTRIVAAEGGVVSFSGWNAGLGNTVIIEHPGGYNTVYAHNSRNLVIAGQTVTRGQHIADIGQTGFTSFDHLHFELRRNGELIDPMIYFGN